MSEQSEDISYKWTVQIEIDPIWVRDGFNLTRERMLEILSKTLDFAYEHEFDAQIISAPDPKQIRVEQGHKVEGYEPYLKDE
jgi:hypothetical protein